MCIKSRFHFTDNHVILTPPVHLSHCFQLPGSAVRIYFFSFEDMRQLWVLRISCPSQTQLLIQSETKQTGFLDVKKKKKKWDSDLIKNVLWKTCVLHPSWQQTRQRCTWLADFHFAPWEKLWAFSIFPFSGEDSFPVIAFIVHFKFHQQNLLVSPGRARGCGDAGDPMVGLHKPSQRATLQVLSLTAFVQKLKYASNSLKNKTTCKSTMGSSFHVQFFGGSFELEKDRMSSSRWKKEPFKIVLALCVKHSFSESKKERHLPTKIEIIMI